MHRILPALFANMSLLTALSPAFAADRLAKPAADRIDIAPADWPWWRGPTRDGIAAANQKPPLHWSESQNVLWKTAVPGRGHSSPTTFGDQVFLATCDEEREIQSVLCYHRKTGAQVWKTDVHQGEIEKKENKKDKK